MQDPLKLEKHLLCVAFFGPYRDPCEVRGARTPLLYRWAETERAREVEWPEATHSGPDSYKVANPAHSCWTTLKGSPPLPFLEMVELSGPQVVCFLWVCSAYLAWLKDVCGDNHHHKGRPHPEAGEGASM